jgi:hypothetical protein
MVRDLVSDCIVDYHNVDYLEILKLVRDRIHLGHRLLTHPLAGSVKPYETPYRTILMSAEKGNLDEKALNIIEESIETCKKLMKNRNWNDDVLKDFQLIDYGLIFGNHPKPPTM